MMTTESTIRLLLVDDHALFREGLARVLDATSGFAVVGSFPTVQDALHHLARLEPDVVILDVDLGQERALDFVTAARNAGFHGKILVVTAGVSNPEAVQLVQAGVSGILHKHNQPDTLCDVIRQVARGEVYLEPRYLRPLFQAVNEEETPAPKLTTREISLLRLIFRGAANKEIADSMQLSESAVKAALRVLFDKLGVRTRSQLVRVALEQYRDQLQATKD
jgi:two-component system nitrate/nitrite response regulator NarL